MENKYTKKSWNNTRVPASKTSGIKERLHTTERSQELETTNTERILPEWGGNCTKKHWDKCSHLDKYDSSLCWALIHKKILKTDSKIKVITMYQWNNAGNPIKYRIYKF